MNCSTQNAKTASITEKTLIVGIDVGSETHFARAFDWCNYEYSKKPFAFINSEAGFTAFKAWMEILVDMGGALPQRDGYTQGHVKRKPMTFYVVYPNTTIFVLDIEKYP